MSLFFGKFSDKYPEQIEGKYYSAGEEGNEWYGGIKPGDYVFPIYKGKVERLWHVDKYTQITNRVTGEKIWAVTFEEVHKLLSPLRLSDEFIRYKYFSLDLNLLNKSAKSVKNCGFHKISTDENCPEPIAIEFTNNLRNIYVCFPNVQLPYKDGDIRVVIDGNEDYRIATIEVYKGGIFSKYIPLFDLYISKNSEGERYTLKELVSYAIDDTAPNKKSYLEAVISELASKGYYVESSPIRLYDNLVVGRKKSSNGPISIDGVSTIAPSIEPEDTGEPDLSYYEKYSELLEFNPNLILYGPPGTGKTFSALKIIECFDKKKSGIYKPFSAISKEDRVKFVTFHQSYSYEEFIEGIRPQLDLDEAEKDINSSNSIKYKVEDGILKKLANAASTQKSKSTFEKPENLMNVSDKSLVWKLSLGHRDDDTIYNKCIHDEEIAMGWLENINLEGKDYDTLRQLMNEYYIEKKWDVNATQATSIIDNMVSGIRIGDLVMVYNSPISVRAIGVVVSNYFYSGGNINSYPHRRKVKWLKVCKGNEEINISELNGGKRLTLATLYQLNRINASDILKLVSDEVDSQQYAKSNTKTLPYYIIIDEINRGNISKIFGELITLIEKDKRDTISCNLPYSGKPFSLPSNLYIIGTMNTADRSIAILDTALRRRFVFVEIEPDLRLFDMPDVVPSPVVNGTIELSKLLSKLNEKISYKLDRDHRIGHSYFLGINGLGDLYKVWYFKIIPLVTEYFYNDAESIRKIIGESFIDSKGNVIYLDYNTKDTASLSSFEKAFIALYGDK